MKYQRPIKDKVTVLQITKPNQKIRFQIRHPENMYAIIGIYVTCSLTYLLNNIEIGNQARLLAPENLGNSQSTIGNLAGMLSLAIPEKGDVVFSDDVKIDTNTYADLEEINLFGRQYQKPYHFYGKQTSYFKTHYLISDALLEGYYENVFSASGINPPGSPLQRINPNRSAYQVNIYIRYQTLPSC
jgi:hypothetical protein